MTFLRPLSSADGWLITGLVACTLSVSTEIERSRAILVSIGSEGEVKKRH